MSRSQVTEPGICSLMWHRTRVIKNSDEGVTWSHPIGSEHKTRFLCERRGIGSPASHEGSKRGRWEIGRWEMFP